MADVLSGFYSYVTSKAHELDDRAINVRALCAGAQRFKVQIPGRPNRSQCCKLFTTDSSCAQVAVLPGHHATEMGTATSLHL